MVDIPTLNRLTGPPLGFRFAVFFFAGGAIPNPLDILFSRVSGLAATIETASLAEGGQNLYTHKFPRRVGYGNLILERGMVIGSPLGVEFNVAMSLFKFLPSNVMVTLLSEDAVPISAWLFVKAFPVRWATSDLNASEERLVIETLELAYTRMQVIRI